MATVLLRRLAVLIAAVVGAAVPAAPALAHNGHAELPDGFRAEITSVVDAAGRPADLDGVRVEVAPPGIGLTVSNTTDEELIVAGEQAGEPLLRLTAEQAEVNQASPQAVDVEGATVDPSAAAELLDLVWQRAEVDWVALPGGGSVTVIDHRGAPGHPPVRADYETGDIAGEFGIGLTYAGAAYRAVGTITAIEPTGSGLPWPWWVAAAVLALAFGVGLYFVLGRLSRHGRAAGPQPA